MNPQEPTKPNMQSSDPSTQKAVDVNQPTQQSTTAPVSQATMPSQTTVNTDISAATNQTKKISCTQQGRNHRTYSFCGTTCCGGCILVSNNATIVAIL